MPHGKKVELGSGAGFIKKVIPKVITSDVVSGHGIDKVFFAEKMPFANKSISAFYMIDVLHHIKNPSKALKEMDRCLVGGGKIIMIEPANTLWAQIVLKNFHHENFDTKAGWTIKGKGRLTDANMAIPWIIFVRDRKKFEKKFPNLKIRNITPHTPFSYLISGGLSYQPFIPVFLYPFAIFTEKLLTPLYFLL